MKILLNIIQELTLIIIDNIKYKYFLLLEIFVPLTVNDLFGFDIDHFDLLFEFVLLCLEQSNAVGLLQSLLFQVLPHLLHLKQTHLLASVLVFTTAFV